MQKIYKIRQKKLIYSTCNRTILILKFRHCKAVKWKEKYKMAELESSLTALEWLPHLTVGGAMAGTAIGKEGANNGQLSKAHGGQIALRKAPNSPLDTNATLDQNDATNHRDGKPPYSYANLITFAINSSSKKKMTLSEIYQWICDNFPYYKDAGNGWKVSIIC